VTVTNLHPGLLALQL